MVNEIIQINYENDRPTVSARELHKNLEIEKRFSAWFETNHKGFIEGEDFTSVPTSTVVNNGAIRDLDDYQLTIDMAKHLCLMSRTEKGKQARQYFIRLEKDWNSPEKVMARALQIADRKIHTLETKIEEDKPKVIFADAVATAKTSILIGDLAKLIRQNGIEIGQKRLFEWLRQNGYLIKRTGSDWNMPTQKAMDMKLFEIKETTIQHPDGHSTISKTPKVTGKGQQYFINKFLQGKAGGENV